MSDRDAEITRLRAELVALNRQLLARDNTYRDPDGSIKRLQAEVDELRKSHEAILATRGWRTVEMFRSLRDKLLLRRR